MESTDQGLSFGTNIYGLSCFTEGDISSWRFDPSYTLPTVIPWESSQISPASSWRQQRLHKDGLTDLAASEAGREPLGAEDEGEAVGGRRVIRRGRALTNLTNVLDEQRITYEYENKKIVENVVIGKGLDEQFWS